MTTLTKTLGCQVLEALGLPIERCLSLAIDFEGGNVLKATAVYMPDEGAVQGMAEVIRKVRIEQASTGANESHPESVA